MTRTIDIAAAVNFPAGQITLRIDHAQLDAQALTIVQDTLGLMLELATNIDEPEPVEEVEPAPAPKPVAVASKPKARKKSGPKATPLIDAIFDHLRDRGGVHHGTVAQLADKLTVGTPGSRVEGIQRLIRTGRLDAERDGRKVTAIVIPGSAADHRAVENTEPVGTVDLGPVTVLDDEPEPEPEVESALAWDGPRANNDRRVVAL